MPKKFSTKKLKWLRYVKYGILIVMVWALPALLQNAVGMGDPYTREMNPADVAAGRPGADGIPGTGGPGYRIKAEFASNQK